MLEWNQLFDTAEGMRTMTRMVFSIGLGLLLVGGCMQTVPPPAKKAPPKQTTQPAKKQPKTIIGRKTQDIGKYDPTAGWEVSDSKAKITNPITGPLEAYGPMTEKIAKLGIQHNVRMFEALNGRYPTYEEFMSQIIKNKKAPILLPVLPGNMKYQYDEKNHKLVVVKPPAEDAPE